MKKYSIFAAFAFALTLAASPAQALPVETLSISNINETTGLGLDPILFDLNNDGHDDFEVSVFFDEIGEIATINSVFNEGSVRKLYARSTFLI